MLVRQKIIAATAFTCTAIVLLATIAYITAADRVGREQLAPAVSGVFASIFHQQLQLTENNITSLKSLTNQMVQHYQVQEVAVYNELNERIIYSCTTACLRSLPIRYSSDFQSNESTFVYNLTANQPDQDLTLIIEAEISLPEFYYTDTVITTLLVTSISTLFIFLLYNSIRFWQRQPFQNLLYTIDEIRNNPAEKIRFSENDADTRRLGESLNAMIERNEQREEIYIHAKEKAESARIRAIRLSNETRHINEKLAQEITIRRSVENQLKHTQNFLDSIIDSMPSALFALDHNGFIIQCNKQAADWLDTQPEPLAGQRLSKLLPNVETLDEVLKDSHQHHSVLKIERVQLSLPSTILFADITVYPLKDHNLSGLVVRIDDIRQRQKMEEIIVQTEKMKSVGGLAAGMAHEINNPLGAILQGVQNIQRRISDENAINRTAADKHNVDLQDMYHYLEERQVIQFINNIQDAGQRAASIVSNMLQFSRGSQQSLSEISVNDLINRTMNIAQSDLDLKKSELTVHCESNLPSIRCIPSEIEQVILNILQNAAHALVEFDDSEHEHSPEINLKVYQEQFDIVIAIRDNGPGMSEETCRRIFEPFFTTKDIGSGTGLGLSVSYFIITAHHQGQLTVETQLGQGSEFFIRLPVSD